MNDLRQALRALGHNRSFTAVAVVTLALGIGANTAIFGLINTVLLHPLPVKDRDRLVFVYENDRGEGRDRNVVAPANLADFRQRSRAFDKLAPFIWFDSVGSNLGVPGRPERVVSAMISPDLFPSLGIKAVRGRLFTAADRRAPVALISYRLWKSRLGARPAGFSLSATRTPASVVRCSIGDPGGDAAGHAVLAAEHRARRADDPAAESARGEVRVPVLVDVGERRLEDRAVVPVGHGVCGAADRGGCAERVVGQAACDEFVLFARSG